MDTIKKNLPQIAIGTAAVAAIALGIYYMRQEGEKEASPVTKDKKKQRSVVIPKTMPVKADSPIPQQVPLPSGIIDQSLSQDEQVRQFSQWLENKLAKYISKKGTFKLNENDCLNKDDFDRIYHIIECGCRVSLQVLRGSNEQARRDLFERAFIKTGQNTQQLVKARNDYIQQVATNIQGDMDIYEQVWVNVLHHAKVNEHIWSDSTQQNLPSDGENMIRTTLKLCTVTPFKVDGEQSLSSEIQTSVYCEASDFGLSQIRDRVTSTADNFYDLLKKFLIEQDESDDQQEYLIYLDYLMFDWILSQKNIPSLKIKTAICAQNILEDQKLQQQIQKVVDTFKGN